MIPDDAIFEETLRKCQPSGLDDRLLGRLHAVLDTHASTAGHSEIEAFLQSHRPAKLPTPGFDRLVALVPQAPENIVPLPENRRILPFRRYAAAAAIALVGAVSAFFSPLGDRPAAVAERTPSTSQVATADATAFVPATYTRGLAEARQEGLVWNNDAPHRVLRIVYTDKITLQNNAGETVEMEQPHVEYILVPEKID